MARSYRLADRSVRTLTKTEAAWVAGLLEGEGSFICIPRKRIRISMSSTDVDVLLKLSGLIDGGVYPVRQDPRTGRKPVWHWKIQRRNDVLAVMEMVYPHMGSRRRLQIDACRAHVEE